MRKAVLIMIGSLVLAQARALMNVGGGAGFALRREVILQSSTSTESHISCQITKSYALLSISTRKWNGYIVGQLVHVQPNCQPQPRSPPH